MTFLEKYKEQIYAIFRIAAGFLFLWHGTQKLLNYPPLPEGVTMQWHAHYIGGVIEMFGGFFIMIGLFTRWSAFLASGEMAAAFWTVHIFMGILPLQNRGELAMLYCFVFLFIAAKGSGIWSVDNLIRKSGKIP